MAADTAQSSHTVLGPHGTAVAQIRWLQFLSLQTCFTTGRSFLFFQSSERSSAEGTTVIRSALLQQRRLSIVVGVRVHRWRAVHFAVSHLLQLSSLLLAGELDEMPGLHARDRNRYHSEDNTDRSAGSFRMQALCGARLEAEAAPQWPRMFCLQECRRCEHLEHGIDKEPSTLR